MKLSKLALTRNKILQEDKTFAQELLLKSGQLYQFCSGVYGYDNVLYLVMKKVKDVISKHLSKADCVEVNLPILQPESLWIESQRLQKYLDEQLIYQVNRDNQRYVLGPTAEETMVDFLRARLTSYKMLPTTFFQIQTKFRDEIRSRGYLIRGKVFEMLDAYSFARNEAEMKQDYERMKKVYFDIFDELGLQILPVGAESGSMGGKKSEEFMILTEIGEDVVYYDEKTNKAFNQELLEREDAEEYLKENYGITEPKNMKQYKALEAGHNFELGTFYSDRMKIYFVDENGQNAPYYMGCYGIGVSRVTAVIYEKSKLVNDKGEFIGFSLPYNLAPYKVQIIYSNNEQKQKDAESLYEKLQKADINSLIDDRNDIMFGARIKDANLLGTPYVAVFGNKTEDGQVEIENTKTKEKQFLTIDQAVEFFKSL